MNPDVEVIANTPMAKEITKRWIEGIDEVLTEMNDADRSEG